jgi:hypothetical protein
MTEAQESQAFVANWLRQAPEFMDELGLSKVDLKRLRWLGSGGRADAVYLGQKQVLKITNDSAQAAMSQAAMEDEPLGIIPVYAVVATDIPGRAGAFSLPDLPPKGSAPIEVTQTWGIVEKLVVPVGSLRQLGAMSIAGESPEELIKRYAATRRAYDSGVRASDPLVEEWRLLYAAALEWVEETCEAIGSSPLLDLHEDNWGVDPDTGDLLLIDLGQCYAVGL